MCQSFNALSAHQCKKFRWAFFILFVLLIPYGRALAVSQSPQPGGPTGNAPSSVSGPISANQGKGKALQPWTVKPTLMIGQVYLNESRKTAVGGAYGYNVTEVNPQLAISGRSPRAGLNLTYRMQNLLYAGRSAADTTYHQLNATGDATLIRNLLFFDASGYMSQQLISPNADIPLGNFSISSNRTDVRTYSLSPYIHYNLGTTATTTVRFQRQRLTYSKRSQYDNNSNIFSMSVDSGPSFEKLSWGLNGYEERVLYDSYPSVSFETVQAHLGWSVSRSLMIQGSGGYDRNRYSATSGRTRGKRWSFGFTWSPGIRTSLSASYGRRYFGNTYSLKFDHRARLMTWSARYDIQPSTIRGLQNSSFLVGFLNSSGQVTLVNFLLPTITQQVFITKRGRLSITRDFNQGNLNTTLYDVRRDYQQTGEHFHYYGLYESVSRKVGRRTSVSLHGAWVRYLQQGVSGYYYWYAGLGLSHQLGRNVRGRLRYYYAMHPSTSGSPGYSENVASAFLDITF